jgi:hypothetical protein
LIDAFAAYVVDRKHHAADKSRRLSPSLDRLRRGSPAKLHDDPDILGTVVRRDIEMGTTAVP